MSWLDDLLGNVLSFGGELLPQRKTWRLLGLVQAVDNPDTGTTDITFAEPPIGPPIDIDGETEVTKESSGTTLYLHNGSVATLPDDAEMGTKYRLMFSVGPGASASLEVANDGFQNIYWDLNGANQSGQTLEIDGEINALYEIELFTETDGDDVYRSWIVSPIRDEGPFVANAVAATDVGGDFVAGTGGASGLLVRNYGSSIPPFALNGGSAATLYTDLSVPEAVAAGAWTPLFSYINGGSYDGWAGFFQTTRGVGVEGWTNATAGDNNAGVVGVCVVGAGAEGAGVLGLRDYTQIDEALAISLGAGVFGHSTYTAGVYGYTPTTGLPGVQGGAGHAAGLGVHGYAGAVNPATEAASWGGAGVAGSSKVANRYGVGGEYLNATDYGEGIEGWNAAWGPGIAGYAANGAGDSFGVIGGLKNTTTTLGAGVVGYHGIGSGFGAGGLWTDATPGACGVFGISDLTAGVFGLSGAAGVPGVKADAYGGTPTGQSHAIHARKGDGTAGTAIFASPRTGTYSAASQIWSGTTITAIMDSDIGTPGDEWAGIVVWSPRTTNWVSGVWSEVNNGAGVWGFSKGGGTFADDAIGVVGHLKDDLTDGCGVMGYRGVGVYAIASAAANGAGVVGASDLTAGVYGISAATALPGVLGVATTGNASGGEFYGHGTWAGVYGQTTDGVSGVQGYADGTGHGGYFEADGSGSGVIGDSSGGTGHGVIAKADTTTPVSAALLIIGQDGFPSSPQAGAVIYHTGNNKHYGYNGSGWQAFY